MPFSLTDLKKSFCKFLAKIVIIIYLITFHTKSSQNTLITTFDYNNDNTIN